MGGISGQRRKRFNLKGQAGVRIKAYQPAGAARTK